MESKKFESQIALGIAIFASLMAITDLYASRYGEEEITLTNERASAYSWYQSKSIKESLNTGLADILRSLVQNGAIQNSARQGVHSFLQELGRKSAKYELEKKEILMGSKKLPPEQWSQEVNGTLGQVVGAQEMEERIKKLEIAGDRFDLSQLFFQLCLVFGAISLVLQNESRRRYLFYTMFVLGIIATGFASSAFLIV